MQKRADKGLSSAKKRPDVAPDKLERLKDENLALKRNQTEMQNEIKVISTKLKRLTEQLKSDKGSTAGAVKFEKALDSVIEEQVNLQNESQSLMKKVKNA